MRGCIGLFRLDKQPMQREADEADTTHTQILPTRISARVMIARRYFERIQKEKFEQGERKIVTKSTYLHCLWSGQKYLYGPALSSCAPCASAASFDASYFFRSFFC